MTAAARTLLWFAALLLAALLLLDRNMGAARAVLATRSAAAGAGAAGGPAALGLTRPGRDDEPPLAPPRRPGERHPFSGQAIEDPCLQPDPSRDGCRARAMDPFYAALARLERREPGAVARVLHVGDSIVAVDNVSSRLRDQLQTGFGDGGVGFVYLGKPSRWYERRGVHHDAGGWVVRSIVGELRAPDGLYGLGGASFETIGPGARATFATPKAGHLGERASRIEVQYLEQPRGGSFDVLVDGDVVGHFETDGAPAARPAFRAFEVPDARHVVSLRTTGGRVRAFGVVLERDQGLVYDGLGLVSNSAWALGRMDAAHWQEQLAHRGGDLVVVFVGANETGMVGDRPKTQAAYEARFAEVLRRVRSGLPGAACLVMSPLDAAEQKDGRLVTKPALPVMVEEQRRSAARHGCAFWDGFAWMGGEGSMARWHRKGLVAGDYVHPTRKGSALVADALYEALLHGYEDWQLRQAGAR